MSETLTANEPSEWYEYSENREAFELVIYAAEALLARKKSTHQLERTRLVKTPNSDTQIRLVESLDITDAQFQSLMVDAEAAPEVADGMFKSGTRRIDAYQSDDDSVPVDISEWDMKGLDVLDSTSTLKLIESYEPDEAEFDDKTGIVICGVDYAMTVYGAAEEQSIGDQICITTTDLGATKYSFTGYWLETDAARVHSWEVDSDDKGIKGVINHRADEDALTQLTQLLNETA